jgi:dolichyl-phosphate-mannose-protein mannosyltransferase
MVFHYNTLMQRLRNKSFALVLIIALGFFLRIYQVGLPPEYYFDEVYHPYTARQYLNGNKDAYLFAAKSPDKDVAYEWVHPPTSKLIMAGFMGIFGENSFGWRIGSVLFGTGIIFMIYLITKKLFDNENIALLAAFFAATENLLITMSRIAMNDSYFILFLLLAIYTYLKYRTIFITTLFKEPRVNRSFIKHTLIFGLALGLAIATKWSALYAIPFIASDLIINGLPLFLKRKPNTKVLLQSGLKLIAYGILILIPLITVYLLSYGQFFLQGNTFNDFIETTKQIYMYHSRLVATHPFQSTPSQWIFSAQPVYMYFGRLSDEFVSAISNNGNYVLFIAGLVAIFYFAYLLGKKYQWQLMFVLLGYLWMFMPWAFSPRIMFFYHYTPAVPFLLIALSYFVWQLYTAKNMAYRYLAVLLCISALIMTFLIYPLTSGLPIPKTWFDNYYSKTIY